MSIGKRVFLTLLVFAIASFLLAWFAPNTYNAMVNGIVAFLEWIKVETGK